MKNGPIGLVGRLNAGSVDVDFDLGQDRGHFRRRGRSTQAIADGLLQHEPDRALGLRDADVERLRRDLRRRLLGLHEDVPDLRTVAVDDDQLVAVADDLRQPARGLLRARDLLFLRAAILGTKQRIAAEGDDRQLHQRSSRSSGMVMQRGPPRARDSSLPAICSAYFLSVHVSSSVRPRSRSSS